MALNCGIFNFLGARDGKRYWADCRLMLLLDFLDLQMWICTKYWGEVFFWHVFFCFFFWLLALGFWLLAPSVSGFWLVFAAFWSQNLWFACYLLQFGDYLHALLAFGFWLLRFLASGLYLLHFGAKISDLRAICCSLEPICMPIWLLAFGFWLWLHLTLGFWLLVFCCFLWLWFHLAFGFWPHFCWMYV